MQELSSWSSTAPNDQLAAVLELGLMRFADQRRQYVAGGQIIVVPGPIQIGRHGRDKIPAVLMAVGLTKFETGDLGDRVPLIGRLQGTRKERVFDNGLVRMLG